MIFYMKRKYFLLPVFLMSIVTLPLFSQNSWKITVDAGDHARQNCPVYAKIPGDMPDNISTDSLVWSLQEITGKEKKPVACQQEGNGIWFILKGTTPARARRVFLLERKRSAAESPRMKVEKDYASYLLKRDGQPVLSYRFRTQAPPAGVDPLYQKSGYIHPLWSPAGDTLTRIQPPDHRHHYGLWGPWTKTHIDGREVDFWNLGKGQGTVRYAGLLGITEGPVFCGIQVHQEHIDFGAKGPDRTALDETLQVRAWDVGDHAWMVDYTTTQSCPLPDGILLDAYRYGGGLGYRATERWTRKNSTVLTSEGKTRKDADGTNARWCRIEGAMPEGDCGILFMDHPGNRDYPEPMRVWPEDANKGRGDLFFEFCPIRHHPWTMERGRSYTLRYRMLIFDGTLSPEEAEMMWNGFAYPPEVKTEVEK